MTMARCEYHSGFTFQWFRKVRYLRLQLRIVGALAEADIFIRLVGYMAHLRHLD